MVGQGLAPSPTARVLLSLAERRASGSVDVGGRRLVLREGAVVDVGAAEGDEDLGQFLVHAGRLTAEALADARVESERAGRRLEAVLRDRSLVDERAMCEARRAMWLDHLVAGIARLEDVAAPEPVLQPDGSGAGSDAQSSAELVPLVLDALARLADEGDAEVVGAQPDRLFELLPGPHRDAAERWCDLGGLSEPLTVAQLLSRSPGAARLLAALVRAGVAQLGDAVAGRMSSLPPARAPEVVLHPGVAPSPALPSDVTPRLSRLPEFVAPLDDPLEPVEQRIRDLEAAGDEGVARAAAWKELARLWQSHYGSIAEAMRAWREAAAANPGDVEALDHAAVLCAATGRIDLARAYAEAAVHASEGPARAAAYMRLARIALSAGDREACVRAATAAAEAAPEDPEPHELSAIVRRDAGETAEAARHARDAARRLLATQPGRARALAAWALAVRPDLHGVASLHAEALVADGHPEAAVASLADRSRRAADADERRALRLEAAERAEAAGRPDLAWPLLLESFDDEPHVDIVYEPLAADMQAAGEGVRRAVILEEVAAACAPEDRPYWLTRAAEAHRELPGGADHAADLFARALEADPLAAAPIEALRALAEDASDPTLLADALERVLRRRPDADPDARRDLCLELASLAEQRLGSPHRALFAWRLLVPLLPDPEATRAHVERLTAKVRLTDGVVERAERELGEAIPEDRPRAARTLAAVLREHPEQRPRAAELYREALRAEPGDAAAASALERLLWVLGHDGALALFLRERVAHAETRSERLRLLGRLAALEQLRGDYRACAEACRAVLQIAPHAEEALARLERAARRLEDEASWAEVLRRELQWAEEPRRRARLLVSLARRAADRGDSAETRRLAAQALAIDADAAEAALLLAGSIADASAQEAVEVLRSLRRCFGDSPPLCAALVEAAEASADETLRDEVLDAWCALSPLDPQPAMRRLRVRRAADGAAALRIALDHALGTWAPEVEEVVAAIGRLEEVVGPAEAARVALHAVDRLGHADRSLPRLALRLAEAGGNLRDRVAALERCVAFAARADRVEPLRTIAALWRESGDRAAEARALLRVLEVEPHDAWVLERLATLYAETGESKRLMAVLSLRLEAAGDTEERKERLLDLVSAALRVEHDPGHAEALVWELLADGADIDARATAAGALAAMGRVEEGLELLFSAAAAQPAADAGPLLERAVALAQEHGGETLALETAVRGLDHAPSHAPLLLHFERLALALGDVATARRTYETLAGRAMGRHGRRAILYREARWLERAGDSVAALEAYERAFELSPSLGVMFGAIERLADELGLHEPLVRACLAMAERMPHADRRMELLHRAAELLERELDAPGRAFDVLEEAWRTLGGTALFGELRRLARTLGARDAEAGRAAIDRLVARLRERADKSWDDEDRVRALLSAAELRALDGGDVDAAASLVDEMLGAADVAPEQHAEPLCRLAEWLRAAGRVEEARARVADALARAPEHAGARALAESLGTPVAEPEPASAPRPEPEPQAEPEPARVEDGDEEDRLRAAMRGGDLDAAEMLAARIARDPARRREALDLRVWVLRCDPSRVESLRSLHEAARDLSAGALAEVSAEILSLFDPQLPPPPAEALVRCNRFLERPSYTEHDSRLLAWTGVMRLLWEGGAPLFRKRLADYGVLGTDRVTALARTPVASAWSDAVRVLGIEDVPLYVRGTAGREVFVVATHPPSVIAGSALEKEDPVAVRFRLGRALELARPEHVLIAALPEDEGARLVAAVAAAFGPPELASRAPREAVGAAAALWNTISPRLQQRIRTLLDDAGEPLPYDVLRTAAHVTAARSGAMVAGQVRAPAETLLLDDPALLGSSLDTESGYRAACRASPSLVGMLRFALSDAYLAARARARRP